MKVALVSRNRGKLRELRALVPGWQLEPLDTTGIPDETGTTFEENAREKARWGRRAAPPEVWVMGEDSGLCVDGLGGRPGIRSARHAGEGASDRENLERLLADLEGVVGAGRRGRYVCEIVLLSPDGREARGSGTLEGTIARAPRGHEGFGYDPVFVPDGESRTVAELGERWKSGHSHRALAARALALAVAGSAARGCASVRSMEPSDALADLIEISTQIRAAVIVSPGGDVLAAAGADGEQARDIARGARELVAAATDSMGGSQGPERLVQIQAALPQGSVFVVQDEERLVAAVTVAEPTVGLVFYDLKTCLRHVAGESLAPKPRSRTDEGAEAPAAGEALPGGGAEAVEEEEDGTT